MTMLVIAAALLIDVGLGEPPNRFHPVAWMGSAITWAKRFAPPRGNARQFLFGMLIVVLGATASAATGWAIQRLTASLATSALGWTAMLLLQAAALKCCFGIRSLAHAASLVGNNLDADRLPAARQQLAYHLVSRDVTQLTASEVSAATIESVAENTSDSVVGPLFFFLIGGLPAALAYRYVNTCDAMLGYRTPQLEWLGKFAARTDDVLNFIPARITAALMLLAHLPSQRATSQAWRTWRRDAQRTPSPNGGHPMSVAAGGLGVCLEKPGHYCLGGELRPPAAADIRAMIGLFHRTIVLTVLLAITASWLLEVWIARGTR
ncbi:cobalamin biosynthesis protein [Roseimaritima ulvae]|uniref:Cobalamin biosynthesis protein CobD n=2 Tax=Roseimaritima ulvae TaxID=980254 RepID=A0A5B9QKY4_9BACT|nr:cobalamin biosynthesis protein [Roseimaritima ulvae]